MNNFTFNSNVKKTTEMRKEFAHFSKENIKMGDNHMKGFSSLL